MQEHNLTTPLAAASTIPPLAPAVASTATRRQSTSACPNCDQGAAKTDARLQRWLDLSA